MRLAIALMAVACVGNACGARAPEDGTTSPSRTSSDHDRPSPSPGTSTEGTQTILESGSVDCQVSVRTRAMPVGAGRFELVVSATNETGQPITATSVADCPGPGASFFGLPEGFDATDRCVQGACPGGALARSTIAIAPGSTVDVARATLDTGVTSCHSALPSGSYSVGAGIRLVGIRSCVVGRATVEVGTVVTAPPDRREAPPTRRDPPPRREPPERCPAMACAYEPCPPGVEPPTGCAAVCGCAGMRRSPFLEVQPAPPQPAP